MEFFSLVDQTELSIPLGEEEMVVSSVGYLILL